MKLQFANHFFQHKIFILENGRDRKAVIGQPDMTLPFTQISLPLRGGTPHVAIR